MAALTPDEIHEMLARGLNAGDAQAVAELYEDDAILVSSRSAIVRGRPAILDGLTNLVGARPNLTLNASRVVRNGAVALLYSDWTIVGHRADGTAFSVDVRPTLVARQQTDGTWRIAIDDPSAGES
jgi:uncharacterized protein (TIGR02246 family)